MNRLLAIPLALSFMMGPSLAAEFTGTAVRIRDGDTFVLRTQSHDIPVRFCGIDSPERRNPGYQKAKDGLSALIFGKMVRCVQVGDGTPCDGRSRATNRDRIVAQCFIGDLDISREMVRLGLACDWPKFSDGYYSIDASTCVRRR